MSTTIMAVSADATKPKSICTLVKRMNHRLRVPSLSSPLLSAQATLPAGYSPLFKVSAGKREIETVEDGPDTDAEQEAIGRERCEEALDGAARSPRAGGEDGEDDQDGGRDEERALARPVIAQISEQEVASSISLDCRGSGFTPTRVQCPRKPARPRWIVHLLPCIQCHISSSATC